MGNGLFAVCGNRAHCKTYRLFYGRCPILGVDLQKVQVIGLYWPEFRGLGLFYRTFYSCSPGLV